MSKQPSVMSHNFSQIPSANIQRSQFKRDHGLKTTFDSGYLVPIFVDEALPGDTLNLDMSGFGRLSTPIAPFMDNLFLDTFFFAVPYRLLWDNWQKFCGERKNPEDSIDYLIPTMGSGEVCQHPITPTNGSLADYFGLPTDVPLSDISALPFRAYNQIWNEWFRDENLQDAAVVDTDDDKSHINDYQLKRRCKRHDYFTSCLPWPQKGEAVSLPLGNSAPVSATSNLWLSDINGNSLGNVNQSTGHVLHTTSTIQAGAQLFPANLEADLSEATVATINQLREAFQIQRLLERDARGGTRYTEIIRSHFGVTSPDSRMQRPEYLGGGSSAVNINPIAQTSSTDATSPQGNLAAMGTVAFSRHGFTKSFTEHCVVIGLACVRADLNYQQGVNRMWTRQSRYDFYWPALANLGEQAVLNKEIYAQGTSADDDVFGYQERYAEYRYKPSMITGQMRSNFAQSLDVWHLAQDFDSLPGLNAAFIEENPPLSRVLAVTDYPQFIFDSYFRYTCARPMPLYSVPGMIDHF